MTILEANTLPLIQEAYKILNVKNNNYPDFTFWFWNKVVPGVWLLKDKIYLYLINGEIIGSAIIKKGSDKVNDKLRAVRIIEKYQKRGYGLGVIDHTLKMLDNDKPLVTVSEALMHDFSRIFINNYDFDLVHVHKGIYQPGKLEYQFNGNQDSLLVQTAIL